jgi:GntR family transcriptional regulator
MLGKCHADVMTSSDILAAVAQVVCIGILCDYGNRSGQRIPPNLPRSGHPSAAGLLRLRRAIRNVVEHRDIEPGQALPSERDLSLALKLSRVTVRKAIAGLVEEGLLTQRHGAGTFIAERIVKPMSRLTSFTEDLRERGLHPRSEFFERGIGEVTPEESMALNLSPGSLVVRLHRVRYGQDEPLAIERSVVPASVLPDPMLVHDSLYEALERFNCRPRRALQRCARYR